MPKPTAYPSKKGVTFIFILMVVILVIAGAIVSWSFYKYGKEKGQEETKVKCEQVLARLPLDLIPGYIAPDKEVKTIFGQIKSITEDQISLEAEMPSSDILKLGEKSILRVKITDKTEILKRKMKKEPLEIKEGEEPPLPFEEEKIQLSDLKEGQRISVRSEENIKNKIEFEAKDIILSE